MDDREISKELKNVYDYIEGNRSENAKLFSNLASSIATIETQVSNTTGTVKELAETVKAQGRFPVWQLASFVIGAFGVLAVMMNGYVGVPLKDLHASHYKLVDQFVAHEELTAGINSAQKVELKYINQHLIGLDTTLQREMRLLDQTMEKEINLNDRINEEKIIALKEQLTHLRAGVESRTEERYTKQDAKDDKKILNDRLNEIHDESMENNPKRLP